jgi:hypothetical protein
VTTIKVDRSPEEVREASLYPIPPESALDGEFTDAQDLADLGEHLIAKHKHRVASETRITYAWKDKGGKSKGKLTFGKCIKPSGREKWLLQCAKEADVLIWLAADHLRLMGATHKVVEAALWHELSHIGETEEPDEAPEGWMPELAIVPHDVEMFASELTYYGEWRSELSIAVNAVKQMALELGGE